MLKYLTKLKNKTYYNLNSNLTWRCKSFTFSADYTSVITTRVLRSANIPFINISYRLSAYMPHTCLWELKHPIMHMCPDLDPLQCHPMSHYSVRVCVCVCVCVCVRACVRACARARVCVCERESKHTGMYWLFRLILELFQGSSSMCASTAWAHGENLFNVWHFWCLLRLTMRMMNFSVPTIHTEWMISFINYSSLRTDVLLPVVDFCLVNYRIGKRIP